MASSQNEVGQQGHPGRARKRVVIKEEFVALTGDHVKAVILAQFEYWQHRVREIDRYIEEERARASASGARVEMQPTEGWIYKDARELSEETMLGLARNSMLRHIKSLVEAGYLLQRKNPYHKWDKTLQYRLNLQKMAADLAEIGYSLEGWVLPANGERTDLESRSSKMESRTSNMELRDSTTEFRMCESGTAIPETTSEITTETDLPSVDPSARGALAGEDRPAEDGSGPTDGPTEKESTERPSGTSTAANVPEAPETLYEGGDTTVLSPKQAAHTVAPKPEEALRHQVEAIPVSEVSDEARHLTGELLREMPSLSERDRLRTARLAEHYHRLHRISVLRIAASGVALYATQQRIRHPFSYLLACCVDAEGERSEGAEELLASLSEENRSAALAESEFSASESESDDGQNKQRHHTPEPDPEALAVWEKVLEDVSGEINTPSLRVWFEGTIPVALTTDTLTISVPNGFAKEYIGSRFLQLLEGALAQRLSPTSGLEIVVGIEGSTDNRVRKGVPQEDA